MTIELQPQFLIRDSKKEFVVLTIEEFERLQVFTEDAQDLFTLRQAGRATQVMIYTEG